MQVFSNNYFRRAISILPAIPLLSLGIVLCLKANLGADIYTSFQQGISKQINVNVGNVNLIMSVIILGIFLLIDRSLINVGSVFMAIGIGPLMTSFENILNIGMINEASYITRIIMVIVGTNFIAIALSWYIPINLGVQPMDMVIITISRIIKKTYGTAMYVFNFLMFVGTLLLGGTLGLGTLINLILTGKLVDIFMPRVKPFVYKVSNYKS